ncbi:UbiA family prenyltransferase [Flavihumibacter fluvii]|uniref:UbiA family prenyltransferase n=1 Tax=Flavihumibacter fluvii TaxID=2838157 RepID=UPI001BDF3E35|nr:UbiA family prenyltransferase [Flavihumibacter fluvii]ULQ53531.1 UbiA family prenyltransferase [Flavihumibacter fluvii]
MNSAPLKKTVDFLLFGAVFIAICAVALSIETNLLLGIPLNHPAVYIFIFGSTILQYNLHYLFKKGIGLLSDRDTWSARNRITQKILICLGAVLIAISVGWLESRHFVVMVVLALLASLYSLPLLPFKRRRLKEYGLLKITLLSLEWTLVTVWFPADQYGIDPTSYWLVFVRRFIFMFVLCLSFDIRDMQSDFKAGIRTMPVRLGKNTAYKVADWGLILFTLLSIWQLTHSGNFIFFHAMVLSALVTKWMVEQTKKSDSEYLYLAGVDGMMLLQALLVAIGTI